MILSYLSMFLIYILTVHSEISFELFLHGRSMERLSNIFGRAENGKVRFVVSDLTKKSEQAIVYDYVIHGASPASAWYIKNKPVEVILPNILGTYHFLEYAKRNRHTKVVFLSSYAVYGMTDKKILSENDYGIINPSNTKYCYSEAKRMSEQLCTAYSEEYDLDTSMIRICHTYGPTFDIEHDTRIIPRTIKKILKREDIEIYQDESDFTQYTYVADIAMAILYVLFADKRAGIYNACSNEVVKVGDMIKCMVDSDERIVSRITQKIQDKNYDFIKPKNQMYARADNKRLKSLGWKESFTMEAGIKSMMRYYLDL